MNPFEYAQPQSENEAVALLAEHGGDCTVLAGGMDLMPLLKQNVVQTQRVVDITRVDSLRGIDAVDGGVTIGVLTTLEEISQSPLLAEHPSLSDVVAGVRAIQVRQTGTLGG
ncbi:MAG: FAD binding domain-containing protein, partial [Planctomycetaceae bacterium]|nr:FAD binding domain-containing protein [Planctomycetaceae bacterium]